METVLVTGGSGFVGSHCLIQLLAAGYRVRTTVRNLERKADVLAMLKTGGAEGEDRLSFFAADLLSDAGWAEATAGCDYVLHVASPFPLSSPKNEDDLIRPAQEGTLRALKASRDAGVKRVVLTSSFAAVGYGHPAQTAPFDETNWTNIDSPACAPYIKSKTLAERAAWDFLSREGGNLELSVVNPVGIFGPALAADTSSSILLVKKMMDGSMPGCPNIYFAAVDVRDVADLHLRAMTSPAAKGERFLALAGECISFQDVAKLLKEKLGSAAKKVSTRKIPDWLLRAIAIFDAKARLAVPELGKIKRASNAKAKRVLGWSPRSNEECILATAESLLKLGLIET